MPKKAPSTRATEHAHLTWGIVNIPISVYGGTDSTHGIDRKQFVEVEVEVDGEKKVESHPVGYANVDKVTGEEVPRSEIVKKVRTDYGFVYVEDGEIEKLFDISPKTVEVKAVQPRHLFDQGHYVPKALYHVVAQKTAGKGGKKIDDPRMQQNLALILQALEVRNAIALVEFTMRGVPKPGVLLPDGTLWVVYHDEELRERHPVPEFEIPDEVAEAAFEQYFKALWSETPQSLEDKRTALIQQFAEEKAQAGDFGKSETPEIEVVPAGTGPDLMAQLQASIDAAKAV